VTTSLEDLARLMGMPHETEGLEFKEAKKQHDLLGVFRYCVAIANEGGGELVLGVSDGPPSPRSRPFAPAPTKNLGGLSALGPSETRTRFKRGS
jgi:hypothetical protein